MQIVSGVRNLLFVDDLSKMLVYFLKKKSDAFSKFNTFKAMVEKEFGRNIKVNCSRNGQEVCSIEFTEFCEKERIQQQISAPHTPQESRVLERQNIAIFEMAKCRLVCSIVPNKY